MREINRTIKFMAIITSVLLLISSAGCSLQPRQETKVVKSKSSNSSKKSKKETTKVIKSEETTKAAVSEETTKTTESETTTTIIESDTQQVEELATKPYTTYSKGSFLYDVSSEWNYSNNADGDDCFTLNDVGFPVFYVQYGNTDDSDVFSSLSNFDGVVREFEENLLMDDECQECVINASYQEGDFYIADGIAKWRSDDFSSDEYFRICANAKSGEYVNFLMMIDPASQQDEKDAILNDYDVTINSIRVDTVSETEAPTEDTKGSVQEDTYEHNEFYDLVQEGMFNLRGYTYVIHKIEAKQDVSISATVIAYDENGNVVGKATDDVCLTAGQNTFFTFQLKGDVSNCDFEFTARSKGDSSFTGERNAVQMVKWNKSGDDLYITLEQTGEIDTFSKFKLLYYKDGEIVGVAKGEYFSVRAENLVGPGSTDVARVGVDGIDFDDIEYVYEP